MFLCRSIDSLFRVDITPKKDVRIQEFDKRKNTVKQQEVDNPKNIVLQCQSRDSQNESLTSTELFVEGIAVSARERCALSPPSKKINDVLGGVAYLIEQLEADRQYTEEALHKEKKIKRLLEKEVDSISLWRQQEHSFAVQKEHEASIGDIAELKLQLKQEKEKLDQAQERLSHTEVLNQRLNEDISFAKNQIPIVKEKLGIQKVIINQINTAQAEADEEYCDLKRVQEEFKKMKLDSKNEKISLEQKLLIVKHQLSKKMADLNQLKMLEKGLNAEIKDAEEAVALVEEKCATLTERIPEITELEKVEKDQILQVKLKIENEMQQNRS